MIVTFKQVQIACTTLLWNRNKNIKVHTLQLNFFFYDWLFSKYAEYIENVHCTLRTAPRLRKMLLVRDHACEHHMNELF